MIDTFLPLPVSVTFQAADGEHVYTEVLLFESGAYRLLIPPEVTNAQLAGTQIVVTTERVTTIPVIVQYETII